MPKVFLIFPHQLFEVHFTKKEFDFHLLEEPLYFSQYLFHKQKLVLHRASMKYYAHSLEKKGREVRYWEEKELKGYEKLVHTLQHKGTEEVHYCTVSDDWLEQKIQKELGVHFTLVKHKSPMFLSSGEFMKEQLEGKKHFSMATFYMAQRKRLHIMVDDNKPWGGKWSFDTENRKKLPQKVIPPIVWTPQENEFVKEAKTYVVKHYSKHYGELENFAYATTHQEAQLCLEDFLENRFDLFGPYEDAISRHHAHVFHSVLSPYLNIGLLTPEEVVQETLAYAEKHSIGLNSLEGFVRQIIGWREFMLGVYLYKGRRERTVNFWDHTRRLPQSFWEGTTGILPIDSVIKKVLNLSYSHHIERLMVMGNFMFLCEISPDDIYRWFMEMYIDAYDWVMVPNVYSMSQYAGGGTATTKPYLSGSHYLLKMSDFPKGEWCEIWDALYWRFIDKYKEFFAENPRLSTMTLHLKKMDKKTLAKHHQIAEAFLRKLDKR